MVTSATLYDLTITNCITKIGFGGAVSARSFPGKSTEVLIHLYNIRFISNYGKYGFY